MRTTTTMAMVLWCAVTAAGAAFATTATLVGDAFTISTSGSAKKGTAKTLDIAGPPDSAVVKTGYLQFDLSTLPPTITAAEIDKATLTVFVKSVSSSGAGSFDLVRVVTPWTESTLSAGSAPALGSTEQSAVPVAATDKNTFKVVDVTNVVKAWRDGSLTNNGLAIVANAVDGLNAKFDSKESTANSQVPHLEITLKTTAAGTVTNVSAASPLSVTNGSTTPNLTLGTVPVASGGTNATTAASARTNLGAAASGANSDITSMTGLTTPLSIAQGGTGASSAAGVRANIGAAAIGSNADISSLTNITGNITMPDTTNASTGIIMKNGFTFLHNYNSNTFLGSGAGNTTMTGSANTGIGPGVLQTATTASSNTAVGFDALGGNNSGDENVAIGVTALTENDSGANNIAVGVQALTSNTTGNQNIAVGSFALLSNDSGSENIAIGHETLLNSETGSFNIAIGNGSLADLTTGQHNIALGPVALASNDNGAYNIAVGHAAQLNVVSGSGNVAVGDEALRANITGHENVGIGDSALFNNTASGNTAVGASAQFLNTTGANNTAVGSSALSNNTTSTGSTAIGASALENSTGASNTAVGSHAMDSNGAGAENTALGVNALSTNTSAAGSTAVGFEALAASNVSYSTAVGYKAMRDSTTLGTAVGAFALSANTGFGNSAFGYKALESNTFGASNVAVGYNSQSSSTDGFANASIGFDSLAANVNGDQNTALGAYALSGCTGIGNIAVGYQAGALLTTGFNNIAIGNNGVAGESSTIRIGDSNHHNTYLAGVYFNTSSSGINVLINGSGKLGTTTSSKRFKRDIKNMSEASRGLMQLRPVIFHYKKEIDDSGLLQYGLIAEEVAKIYPDMVVWENGQPQTVRYHFLVPMLLNELQKQNRRVEAQAKLLEMIATRTAALERVLSDPEVRQAAAQAAIQRTAAPLPN